MNVALFLVASKKIWEKGVRLYRPLNFLTRFFFFCWRRTRRRDEYSGEIASFSHSSKDPPHVPIICIANFSHAHPQKQPDIIRTVAYAYTLPILAASAIPLGVSLPVSIMSDSHTSKFTWPWGRDGGRTDTWRVPRRYLGNICRVVLDDTYSPAPRQKRCSPCKKKVGKCLRVAVDSAPTNKATPRLLLSD